MNENTKLFVFSVKEVILIIIFNICVAVTFFMLGVKIGKDYSYKQAGYTVSDQKTLDVLSSKEEDVLDLEKSKKTHKIDKSDLDQQLKQHLKKELEKKQNSNTKEIDNSSSVKTDTGNDNSLDNIEDNPDIQNKLNKLTEGSLDKNSTSERQIQRNNDTEVVDKKSYIGKYTIQLGSFKTLSEAKEFASGFLNRGYEPIISKAHPKGKSGTWYRISTGIFDTISDLKDYVEQEKNFFRSQSFFIAKIKE